MPRKAKNISTNEPKKSKKNLLNTLVKNIQNKDEHIIMQLPITQNHIDKIINNETTEDNNLNPIPYERYCCFLNEDHNKIEKDLYTNQEIQVIDHNNKCCFWCCHNINYNMYGMPINYDSINDTYILYGSFCSLQCANAYNFSVHNGSDKVWEINSMIQMLGKRYGISYFIRPAPSRYLLQMFNGELSIEDFRKLHHNTETTHILNLPPMISITSTHEIVNTSYI